MRAVAILLLAVACGRGDKGDNAAATRPEVQGTLSLDGKPLTVTKCRAGRGVTTYVELVTAVGKLRFEDKQLFWSAKDFGKGDKLDCTKLDRSWGGGMRKDGTAYFRGHLIFVCRGPAGAVAGDVTVDCGDITAEERAQLDKNRSDMLAEQAAHPIGAAAKADTEQAAHQIGAAAKADRCDEVDRREAELFGDTKAVAFNACREDKWPADVQACAIAADSGASFDACLPKPLWEAMQHRRD